MQTAGSLSVLGSFVASEIAARALAAQPGSAVLWFLNLEVFGIFERARAAPSPVRWLFDPASLWIATALMVAALAAAACRARLTIALIANLTFACAASLGYTLFFCRSAPHIGSLLPVDMSARTDGCVVVALLVISALAAAAGHLSFVGQIASERSRGASPCGADARSEAVARAA